MNNRGNGPWRPQSTWPWQGERKAWDRGRGRGGSHRPEPWHWRKKAPPRGAYRNPSPPPIRSKPILKPRKDDSSDEEVRAEKQRTKSLVKSKLSSLTAEDKSNSMRQLLEKSSENVVPDSVSKEAGDAKIGEKELRRIAHVPKPVRSAALLPPPAPPQLLAQHLGQEDKEESDDCGQKAVQKSIKRKLLKDLLVMPINDLKVMINCPKAQDNLFLSHLMKKTRVSLSDAMRKLAEHKLQPQSDNPQMLTELESLVDPDIAVDVCRMPLETIQALRDIFNLNLDGDLDLISSRPNPLTPLHSKSELYNPRSPTSDSPSVPSENAPEVHNTMFQSPEALASFQWHTPTPFRTNDSFLPNVFPAASSPSVMPCPVLFPAYMTPPLPPSPPPVEYKSLTPKQDSVINCENSEVSVEKINTAGHDNNVLEESQLEIGRVIEGIQNVVKKLEEDKKAVVSRLKRQENSPQYHQASPARQDSVPSTPTLLKKSATVALVHEKVSNSQVRTVLEHSAKTTSVPLSEKIKNMKEVRERRECELRKKNKKHKHRGPTRVAISTQTAQLPVRNSSSQYEPVRSISVMCQTPIPTFVNSSVQTLPKMHGFLHAHSQTEPCINRIVVPTANAETQTNLPAIIGLDFGTQTDNVSTCDKETQHLVEKSHRGEQVNRSFLTSNKYAQTSVKSLPTIKPEKKEDSHQGKSSDKTDKQKTSTESKKVEKTVPIVEEDRLEGVEGTALAAEFHCFRKDLLSLGGNSASPLRRRLVSHMAGFMSSAFQNFYKLFAEMRLSSKPLSHKEKGHQSSSTVKEKVKNGEKTGKPQGKRKRSRSPSNDSNVDGKMSKKTQEILVKKSPRSRSHSFDSNRGSIQSIQSRRPHENEKVLKKSRKSLDLASRKTNSSLGDRKVTGDAVAAIKDAASQEDLKEEEVNNPIEMKSELEMSKIRFPQQETAKRDPSLSTDESTKTKLVVSKKRKLKSADDKAEKKGNRINSKQKDDREQKYKRLSLKEMFTDSDASSGSDLKEKRGKWQMISDSDDEIYGEKPKQVASSEPERKELNHFGLKQDSEESKIPKASSPLSTTEDHLKYKISKEPSLLPSMPSIRTDDWYKKEFKLCECYVIVSMPAKSSAPPTPTYESPVHEMDVPPMPTSPLPCDVSSDESRGSDKPPTPTPQEQTLKVIEDTSVGSPKSPWASEERMGANSATTASDGPHDLTEDCVDGKKKVTIGPMEFEGHKGSVSDFKISGNHLLVASEDAVYCFSLKSGKRKRVYLGHTAPVVCLSVLPKKGGEVVYTAERDQILRAFCVQTSLLMRSSTTPLGGSPVSMDAKGVAVANGCLYVGLDNGEALSVHPQTLKVIRRLRISEAAVLCVLAAVVNERRVLIASAADCQLSLREVALGGLQQRLDWHYSVPAENVLFHEERLYCSSKEPFVIVFRFSSDAGWVGPTQIPTSPDPIALAIVDHCLFIGSRSGSIAVIDAESGAQEAEFSREVNLTAMAIHKNKKMVVASFEGGKLVSWPLPQRVRNLLHT